MSKKEFLKSYIREKINNKEWLSGNKIPVESALQEEFSLSRNTVRNALRDLIVEGLLFAKQGSGYFVNETEHKKKPIIVIVSNQYAKTREMHKTFNNVVDLLKKKIVAIGYEPLDIIAYKEPILDYDKIAGCISLCGNEYDVCEFVRRKIPVVTFEYKEQFPSVITDNINFYFQLKYLFKKYSFKNILIFSYKNNINKRFNLEFVRYAIEKNLSVYNLVLNPITSNHINYSDIFKRAVKKQKKAPDVIVFMDDSLYLNYKPLFDQYDVFKKTKIITHSSQNIKIDESYKVCLIEYDLNELSQKAVDLMKKLIDKEYIEEYNIKIKSKIKNEKALK
ncbi:MAG: GntR family transcriptional regulator [Abditibacteriota bacterium]|nr:GntR family transcriptional regulator [Abditibacteriota bacterium]